LATIKRRLHTSRNKLGAYRIYELLVGKIDYPVCDYTGYGDGSSTNVGDFVSDEMKADWEANRDRLLKFWQSGEDSMTFFHPESKPWLFVSGTPGTLPWAARKDKLARCQHAAELRDAAPR
jgi:hypothetical protein